MSVHNLELEMPHVVTGKKAHLALRLLPVWVLLCCAAGLYWWIMAGRVVSSWAMLDAIVYPITSDFAARVKSVEVREGDSVREGQIIARLDVRDIVREFQAARRDVSGLRVMLPYPDMKDAANRLRQVQESEQDLTRRIAAARHEESVKKQEREDLVAKHVQVQLALRALENQGGAPVVGQTRYEAAKEAEARARSAMERAKEDFEKASLIRAAMDQEMSRLREESLHYKRLFSRTRYGTPNYTRDAINSTKEGSQSVQEPDGNLYAPRDGLILQTPVMSGQMVHADEPVALLLPHGNAASTVYWVLAYFTFDVGAGIKPGQKCTIGVKGGEKMDFSGSVCDVLEPQRLPDVALSTVSSVERDAGSTELFVPVRILINNIGEHLFKPGTEVTCTVMTHHILP